MKDFKYILDGLDQRASGTITITDFNGLIGKTVTVNGTVLTDGAEFNAAVDEATTATSLASAIDALASINSSAVLGVVTIHADAPGTAGNAITLATDAVSGVTLSDATLSGGADETFTDWLPLYVGEGNSKVETSIDITSFAGASGGVIITPQYSYDKVVAYDDADSIFTTINAMTALPFKETKDMSNVGDWVRFKIVTSGTVSAIGGFIYAVANEEEENSSDIGFDRTINISDVSTSNADPTEFTRLTIEVGKVYHIKLIVIGKQDDGSNRASWELDQTVYGGLASAVLQGSSTINHAQKSDIDWDVNFDIVGYELIPKVTGKVGQNIAWGGFITYKVL